MSTAKEIAVVTGASSGIGRETAIQLSRHLPVVAVARRADDLRDTAGRGHAEIVPVVADITTEDGLAAIVAAAGDSTVRYLVHGAGIYPIASVYGLDVQTWRATMATNVDARLFLTQRLAENFSPGSRVLFIGSLSAHKGRKGGMAYCTSKAASFMLQQCLRMEFAAQGVLFANTYPGFVDTALMHGAIQADRSVLPDAAEYAAAAAQGKLVAPQTVARFYRWLLTATGDEEFNRDDWKIVDTAHHAQWLGEDSLSQPSR
ncbi:MAG: SDR family oxidoreductase [Gammaproteobacteria bacterium]|nr:SDR family oxidoreductase [Gammaproteobacteria bacterium]